MIGALANHLLQSTIFAAVAGLLTLLLRNNHARIRYWLWLAASVKFFVPFSPLIAIGHRIPAPAAQAIARPQVATVIQTIGEPFTPRLNSATASAVLAVRATPMPTGAPGPPIVLLVLWGCGFVSISLRTAIRWRRIAKTLRNARTAEEGRELGLLRHLEEVASITPPTGLVFVNRTEPGVFGIVHPKLLIPADIPEHLNDAELDSILTHELCHIRRRDNLTSAFHMAVEAVFWFYPLVWWIGKRLVDERERACDEEVVRLGSEPEVYAESILKICRHYVATPLVCAAGVSGSDLRKRIEAIMGGIEVLKSLSAVKKVLLASAAALVLTAPVMVGMFGAAVSRAQTIVAAAVSLPASIAQAAPPDPVSPPAPTGLQQPPAEKLPAFLAADVHVSAAAPSPNAREHVMPGGRYEIQTATMRDLIERAYGVGEQEIAGGPAWLAAERFDITASEPPGTTAATRVLMLQALLADRFGLTMHRGRKAMQAFAITVDKGGVKMKQSASPAEGRCGPKDTSSSNDIVCTNTTISDVAQMLPDMARFYFWTIPVVDETNLKGKWDFELKWEPPVPGQGNGVGGLHIIEAMRKQLGLKVAMTQAPVEVLFVDKVNEKPTPNASNVTEKLPVAPTEFEVADIKASDPASTVQGMGTDAAGRFNARGATLQALITFAWNITAQRIVDAPKFLNSDRYEIVAKAFSDGKIAPGQFLDDATARTMVRNLLGSRFGLAVHNEDRPASAYVLTSNKPKLTKADPSNRSDCQNLPNTAGGPRPRMMVCANTTMDELVAQLVRFAPGYFRQMPVLNETGIEGAFDFRLNFSPEKMVQAPVADPDGLADPNGAISIFDAIKEQLGLKLELNQRQLPVLVIDRVEQKPTDN